MQLKAKCCMGRQLSSHALDIGSSLMNLFLQYNVRILFALFLGNNSPCVPALSFDSTCGTKHYLCVTTSMTVLWTLLL